MTMTKIPVVADLGTAAPGLGLEVKQGGRDGAVEELEAVETQLAKIRRQQERRQNQVNLPLHPCLGDLVDVIPPPIRGPRAARHASRVDLPRGQASAGPRETED
jgi:hypothetical protein